MVSGGSKQKKAQSLPLNLSHGKDKGFSHCFCRFLKALTPFYDKLSLQFNSGLEVPRCREASRQEVRRRHCSYPDMQTAGEATSGCKKRPDWW